MSRSAPTIVSLLLILLYSCSKQDVPTKNDTSEEPPMTDLEIEDFIWKGLNLYYLWESEVPDLQDNRFQGSKEYENFLEQFETPEKLFKSLLASQDRNSYIVDDYEELQKSKLGNYNSNGMSFGLIGYSDNDKITGYVRYVVEGSDAWLKGIKRGDLFTGIDDIPLTRSNYYDLLYGPDSGSYYINLASMNADNEIIPTNYKVELIKSQSWVDPIHLAKTIDLNNGKRIGYLMLNRFTYNSASALNEVFGRFKTENIDELVLDLRYNPGGSIYTSTCLASMIAGQFTHYIYVKLRYNNKLPEVLGISDATYLFRNSISGNEINSLDLNKVYVITSSRTASASELILNGLDPYIEVIQVGDVTYGKNLASRPLYDSPSYSFYDSELNPDHKWVMQPIFAKSENAVGFSDYTEGFQPDVLIKENIRNLGVLGEINEPLLANTLSLIDASYAQKLNHISDTKGEEIIGSDWHPILGNNMYHEEIKE